MNKSPYFPSRLCTPIRLPQVGTKCKLKCSYPSRSATLLFEQRTRRSALSKFPQEHLKVIQIRCSVHSAWKYDHSAGFDTLVPGSRTPTRFSQCHAENRHPPLNQWPSSDWTISLNGGETSWKTAQRNTNPSQYLFTYTTGAGAHSKVPTECINECIGVTWSTRFIKTHCIMCWMCPMNGTMCDISAAGWICTTKLHSSQKLAWDHVRENLTQYLEPIFILFLENICLFVYFQSPWPFVSDQFSHLKYCRRE